MNLLQIASKVPFPVIDGGRAAIYYPLRELVRRGVNAHFAAPRAYPDGATEFLPGVKVHLLDIDPKIRTTRVLWNLTSPIPYNVSKYFSSRALRQLEEIVKDNHFDIIQVDSLHMAAYGLALTSTKGIPIVLREHNVESEIMRHFRNHTRNPFLRLYTSIQFERLWRYEAEVIRSFNMVIPFTSIDEKKLQLLEPAMKSRVIPGGVDTETLRYQHEFVPDSVVLLTNYDWIPNRDSVEFYVREIMPFLSRFKPRIKTILIGNGTSRFRNLGERVPIEARGFLADLNDLAKVATIAVVPLRMGSGMRIKILEQMALGMTVVSTSLGAEGLDVEDGKHLMIADHPRRFAEIVVNLLDSPEECIRIGRNARDLVEQNYSWSSIGDKLYRCYADVIDNG